MDKCRVLFLLVSRSWQVVLYSSRPVICTGNQQESRAKLFLRRQKQSPGNIASTLPSLPAQRRYNLAKFSLACRQFIFNPFL